MKTPIKQSSEEWQQTYDIAFTGLKLGTYTFNYPIDEVFFQHFDNAPIQKSDVQVKLAFTKKHHFFLLDFDMAGTIHAECDRCLVPYPSTVQQAYRLIVKYEHVGELETFGDDGNEDILYITPDTLSINVAQTIYECIVLSIPMQRIPCEVEGSSIVCDEKVLAILDGDGPDDGADNKDGGHDDDSDDNIDPRWAALKKLK